MCFQQIDQSVIQANTQCSLLGPVVSISLLWKHVCHFNPVAYLFSVQTMAETGMCRQLFDVVINGVSVRSLLAKTHSSHQMMLHYKRQWYTLKYLSKTRSCTYLYWCPAMMWQKRNIRKNGKNWNEHNCIVSPEHHDRVESGLEASGVVLHVYILCVSNLMAWPSVWGGWIEAHVAGYGTEKIAF